MKPTLIHGYGLLQWPRAWYILPSKCYQLLTSTNMKCVLIGIIICVGMNVLSLPKFCNNRFCNNRLEAVQKQIIYQVRDDSLLVMNYWEKLSHLIVYSQERRRERYHICFLWKLNKGLIDGYSINWQGSEEGEDGHTSQYSPLCSLKSEASQREISGSPWCQTIQHSPSSPKKQGLRGLWSVQEPLGHLLVHGPWPAYHPRLGQVSWYQQPVGPYTYV